MGTLRGVVSGKLFHAPCLGDLKMNRMKTGKEV